jgi:hypothetical protein
MTLSTAAIRAVLLPIGVLLFFSQAYAQPSKTIRIKNGQDAAAFVPAKDRYQFPEFQPGKVSYVNGNYAVSKLNYCYLLGEVMFISDKGDTLAIADNNMISYAEIGKARFYPQPLHGFVELVEHCGEVALVKKVQYQKGGIEKKGAYQNENDIGALHSATTFTDINGRITMLGVNNTVLMRPMVSYLFMDRNHRFSKAGETSLLKIFSKKKEEIKPYLGNRNFNYANEEDLKKVLRYCSAL